MIISKKFIYSTYILLAQQLFARSSHQPQQVFNQFCTRSQLPYQQESMAAQDYSYEKGTSSVAFVTTPDNEIAKKLAHGIIEKKLAACVNIIPNIQSVYMWEGKVNDDNEYLLMIKTKTSCIENLTKWVRDNHPYSVAEVITIPIEQGNPPYMKWLAESVSDKH